MQEFSTIVWAVGIAAWLAFIIYVFWLARQVWKDQLMRCPETGAVTLVGVEYVSARPGAAPELTVQRCGFWPARKDCARGCLARYDEALPRFTPHPDALKPFEPLRR